METFFTSFHFLNSFLHNFGYLGLFIVLLLEESGIPLPVPGDVFIFIGGTQAKFGKTSFFGVLAIVFIATVIGASILYFISNKLARPVILRFVKFIRVDEERIEKVSLWFAEKGGWAIVIGRLTPGFRTVTSIVAGLVGFPYYVFVAYTGLAAVIWAILYFFLGFFLGKEALYILEVIGRYFITFAIVVLFLALAGFFYFRKKRPRSYS